MKHRKIVRDLAVVTASTAMIGAATCCYVRAGVGSDAVAVFIEGLSCFSGCSLGTASWCLNIALLTMAFLFARKYIGWTTVFNSMLCGPFIDLMNWLLAPVFGLSDALFFRWILFGGGMMLVASSCAWMIRRCPGMSVNDAITSVIAKRLGTSFRAVRMCIDGTLMLTGFLMGGVVGASTVVAVLGTGPLIQFFAGIGKKDK